MPEAGPRPRRRSRRRRRRPYPSRQGRRPHEARSKASTFAAALYDPAFPPREPGATSCRAAALPAERQCRTARRRMPLPAARGPGPDIRVGRPERCAAHQVESPVRGRSAPRPLAAGVPARRPRGSGAGPFAAGPCSRRCRRPAGRCARHAAPATPGRCPRGRVRHKRRAGQRFEGEHGEAVIAAQRPCSRSWAAPAGPAPPPRDPPASAPAGSTKKAYRALDGHRRHRRGR